MIFLNKNSYLEENEKYSENSKSACPVCGFKSSSYSYSHITVVYRGILGKIPCIYMECDGCKSNLGQPVHIDVTAGNEFKKRVDNLYGWA